MRRDPRPPGRKIHNQTLSNRYLIAGLSLHPFALSLSKGIHRKKTGFDKLTPNGFSIRSESPDLEKKQKSLIEIGVNPDIGDFDG
jgi:hypothetical protein